MYCTGAKRKREHANDLIVPQGTRDQLGMGVRRFLEEGLLELGRVGCTGDQGSMCETQRRREPGSAGSMC